jgi:release factor glutamine methyltransferase
MPTSQLHKEIGWLLREKYDGQKTKAAEKDIDRLVSGEHVNYVIGFAPFLSCRIDLSKKPLIPRPETEYWTEIAISKVKVQSLTTKNRKRTITILDLFCGSGCIGIAALRHIPQSKVTFADLEQSYFKGIRKSLRWNTILSNRARCLKSDVFSNIKGSYDYIFANPPYIPTSRKKRLPASVIRQEPSGALFGGQNGLKYIRTLLKEAIMHLKPSGAVFLEFDSSQKKAIAGLAKQYGYTAGFYKDQYDKWRWAKFTLPLPAPDR